MSKDRYYTVSPGLRTRVFTALAIAAFENNYDVWSSSPEVQADDLITYCDNLERTPRAQIVKYVKVWRATWSNRGVTTALPVTEAFGSDDQVPYLSTRAELAPLHYDSHNTLSIRKRKQEVLNPLEEFVHAYEPNGFEEENTFREMFSRAVEWARKQNHRMVPLTLYQIGALARECAIASCAADIPWDELTKSDQAQMDKRAANIQKVLEGDKVIRDQTKVLRKEIFGL